MAPIQLHLDTSNARSRAGDTPPITPIHREGNDNIYLSSITKDAALLGVPRHHEMSPPRTPRAVAHNSYTCRSSRASSTSSVCPLETGYGSVFRPQSSGAFSLEHSSSLSMGLKQSTTYPPEGDFSVFKDLRPYGHGAWSVVRPGVLARHSNPSEPELIAVKQPISKPAVPVLAHEAAVLAHLSRPSQIPSVIQFYGFDVYTTSLIFPAYPLTMEQFVKESHAWIQSEENISLSTLRCPVVKMRQWLFFAYRLCRGLAALKEKGVVHGDIKLGNILLREYKASKIANTQDELVETLLLDKSKDKDRDMTLYEPLIADFSSSHIIQDTPSAVLPKAVNALTIGYCAPELLEVFLLISTPGPCLATPPRTPNATAAPSSLNSVESLSVPVPTFASDLYSLAITLLAAAIGSEPYAIRGASDARKAIYAKCGDPVGFAKGDERGLRCGKGGVVASCLEGCFGKTAEGRTEVETLSRRVGKWVEMWSVEGRGNDRWGC